MEVDGTEAQFLLALRLPVLHWMFKGRFPSTHHATNTTWRKRVVLIMQQAQTGNLNCPGVLEEIMDWSEGRDFRASPEEVTHAQEAPLYKKLSVNEKKYAMFIDGLCHIVGNCWRWKTAVWSPTRQVTETVEEKGKFNQFAELKAIHLTQGIAE